LGLVERAPVVRVAAPAQQLWTTIGEALRDAVVPWPSEPVGTGARWQVVDQIRRAGVWLTRTTRFRLDERHTQRVRLSAAVTERPTSDAGPDPALPSGVRVRALEGLAAGKRRVAFRTKQILPLASDSEIASDLRIEVTPAAGAPQVKSVHLTQVVALVGGHAL